MAESYVVGLEDEINAEFKRVGNPRSATGEIPEGYKHRANRDADRAVVTERAREEGILPLIGPPEVVTERIEYLRSLGINSIRGWSGTAGLDQARLLDSMRMFAEEVMPHFAEKAVTATV